MSYSSPLHSIEEENRMYIETIIEDFAEKIVLYGLFSKKIKKTDDVLIDVLYEHIEDNLEKFLPEPDYDV